MVWLWWQQLDQDAAYLVYTHLDHALQLVRSIDSCCNMQANESLCSLLLLMHDVLQDFAQAGHACSDQHSQKHVASFVIFVT